MSEIMEKLRKWAAVHNLSQIVHFHNYLKGCLAQSLIDSQVEGKANEEQNKERINYYDSLLRINTFLMLYSHTEEWLDVLGKKCFPNIKIGRGGSITRYKPVIRDGFGIDVSQGKWHLLTDCEKLRNCLLHANGRVDLMEDETEIVKIAKRRGMDIKLKRLQVSPNFLSTFAREVELFIDELQNKA